jgi:hypothetical protein
MALLVQTVIAITIAIILIILITMVILLAKTVVAAHAIAIPTKLIANAPISIAVRQMAHA